MFAILLQTCILAIEWSLISQVDAARWLPLFLEGLRETENLENSYVALQGAMELSSAAAQSGLLLAILPSTVLPLRKALEVERLCMGTYTQHARTQRAHTRIYSSDHTHIRIKRNISAA